MMDLGCGNGFLAELLLKSYPKASAILIDHSKPMVEKAQIHMTDYLDRCEIIHGLFIDHLASHNDRKHEDVANEYYNRWC